MISSDIAIVVDDRTTAANTNTNPNNSNLNIVGPVVIRAVPKTRAFETRFQIS
jgi:hypothetical protein